MGGATALDIQWHNYFTVDSRYIHGARQYGVYAEGWSSQFLNTTIRRCFNVGLYGAALPEFTAQAGRDGWRSAN